MVLIPEHVEAECSLGRLDAVDVLSFVRLLMQIPLCYRYSCCCV